MRIGKYYIENVSDLFTAEDSYTRTPKLYYNHKFWYYWQFYFDWFNFHFYIDIVRTDWNKQYKDECINYTEKCKHNIHCNKCSECFMNQIN